MKPEIIAIEQTVEHAVRHAQESLKQGRHDRYLELMHRAAGMDPADHRIPVDVGISFLRRYDVPSARHWFARAVAGTPNKVEVLESIAFVCRNLMRYGLAETYLEQAAAFADATGGTFASLAEVYERSRRTDKAHEMVNRALEMQPNHPMALLVYARLERSAGRLQAGETTVRKLIEQTNPALWSARIAGGYELGLNLDLQGKYDEAMAAFVTAKAAELLPGFGGPDVMLKSRHPGPQAAAGLSVAMQQRWSDQAREGRHHHRRTALLCGHARSGTTLLEQILDSHPRITSAEETPIFSEAFQPLKYAVPAGTGVVAALDGFDPSLLDQQRGWYFDSIEQFQGEQIAERLLVDKNPALTGHLLEVLRFFPETKVIVALRDPRDVCLSNFMHPPAISSYLTLEAAAKAYAASMGFWLAIKPRLLRPAFEIRYEDMVADPEHWARQVLAFLEVDWDPAVLQFHLRARQKVVRSPSYTGVAHPITNRAVGRWKNYEKSIQPMMPHLMPFVEAFGYDA